MKLRDIEIKDFRKLRHAKVSNLRDGANVIAGENEIGKSTLLAAVQAALFQRHNVTGKVLAAMQPFGCSVRPQVYLRFELADGEYRLRKSFGGGGSAELVCPDGRRYANQDADHKLEELLRFQAASRGATDFSTLGMWPLFWVEQGTTFQGLNINADVRTTVHSSLTKEVGDILIGENGDRLRRRIEQGTAAYFTKTGQETGSLAAARKTVETLQAKLAQARDEFAAFTEDLNRLDAAQKRRASLSDPELRNQLVDHLSDAKKAAASLAQLESELQEAARQLQLATAGKTAAQIALYERQELIASVSKAEEDASTLRNAVAGLQTELEVKQSGARLAEQRWTGASDRLTTTRQALDIADIVLRHARASEELGIASAALTKAQEITTRVKNLQTELQALRADQGWIKKLQSAERAVLEAKAYVDSAATKLDFAFPDRADILINGDPLGSRESVLASEPVEVSVAGGRLTVTPGGSEILDRRITLQNCQHELARLLGEIGAPTVEAAVENAEKRTRLEAEQDRAAAVLAEVAPGGLDKLAAKVMALRAEVAHLCTCATITEPSSRVQAELALQEVKQEYTVAEQNVRTANADVEVHRQAVMSVRLELATKSAELSAAERDLQIRRKLLTDGRASQTDDSLAAGIETALQAEQLCQERFAALESAYRQADADAVEARLTGATNAITELDAQIATIDREVLTLQGRLDGLGQKGVGDTCASLESELSLARVRLQVTEQDANALRVLNSVLQAAERDANTRFLEPVIARVQPYLSRIIPGARIQLSSGLELEGLERHGSVEPFFALSVGVREQISVITRIAFADMLADQGITAPIILDDALVYADDERFADALTSLAIASRRHQVLILTCHERRYLKLGSPIGRIEYVSVT
ncbi:MAG: AAA family ATPase [Fimbriimonadaceae bacterium]|nr:AAA family ATPase [Fimbriimonadaceae bacterium]